MSYSLSSVRCLEFPILLLWTLVFSVIFCRILGSLLFLEKWILSLRQEILCNWFGTVWNCFSMLPRIRHYRTIERKSKIYCREELVCTIRSSVSIYIYLQMIYIPFVNELAILKNRSLYHTVKSIPSYFSVYNKSKTFWLVFR